MSVRFDLLDLKIIEELTRNARADAKEIGKNLDISDRTVARRIKQIERTGIVKSYTTILDYDVLRKATSGIGFSVERERDSSIRIGIVEIVSAMRKIGGLAGIGAGIIVQNIGEGFGRGIALSIPKEAEPAWKCIIGVQKLKAAGWGSFNVEFHSDSKGTISFSRNPLIEAAEVERERTLNHLLIKGIVTGLAREVFGSVDLTEETCLLKEDDKCVFRFVVGAKDENPE